MVIRLQAASACRRFDQERVRSLGSAGKPVDSATHQEDVLVKHTWWIGLLSWLVYSTGAWAQVQPDSRGQEERQRLDSLYINEIEERKQPDKVLHAEPLYIDLIRDLGARKGERELNVGVGLTDNLRYDTYQALVEYEWAPADRIGMEVELPFSFYTRNEAGGPRPANQLESLKAALQWSFFVSQQHQTTLALGYIHELRLGGSREPLLQGNKFNPFLIAAKRWGDRLHTLLYLGPQVKQSFREAGRKTNLQINTSLHYMIPGSRNFVGVEVNKELTGRQLSVIARPQLRVSITDNLLVGIVTGIPVDKRTERLSSFLRLIYEPGHRSHSRLD